MKIFDGSSEEKSDEKFLEWIQDNPEAFTLNLKSPHSATLHCGFCGHFKGFTEPVDLTQNTKVCSLDRKEIEKWASAHSIGLHECGSCNP
jgi:hypothetical protein